MLLHQAVQRGLLWAMALRERILAKASEVFDSHEAAESWMAKPAMGLDQQRPVDLFQTGSGAEIVEHFLTRLEYGVYS